MLRWSFAVRAHLWLSGNLDLKARFQVDLGNGPARLVSGKGEQWREYECMAVLANTPV